MMTDFVLTRENYHSPEANQIYMSASQYTDFLTCEAMAIAKINGQFEGEDTQALRVGDFMHAWNEGKLDEFKAINKDELYNKKNELYAHFKEAEKMIAVLEHDDFCMDMLSGEKEVIRTAEFAGTLWKIRMDNYAPERGRFSDLKSTKSIYEQTWSEEYGRRVSFVEAYYYPRAMAIYAEIERLSAGRSTYLDPFIVAVSKESPPDKNVISFADEGRRNLELAQIIIKMDRILRVKNGEAWAERCEHCAWCRMTKVIREPIHFAELMQVRIPKVFDTGKEDEKRRRFRKEAS